MKTPRVRIFPHPGFRYTGKLGVIERMSLRASAHAGVAISQNKVKFFKFEKKKFENPGDSHASVRTGSE